MGKLNYALIIPAFLALFLSAMAVLAYICWPTPEPGTWSPVSYRMGHFDMIDTHGEKVNEQTFLGEPSVFFFGYTYCPNTCPVTLGRLSHLLKQMGPDADRLKVAFVTIDPDRDTPKTMGSYLSSFDRRIMGLVGTPKQTAEMARVFYIFYQKIPLGDGDYTMDHTASMLLFDASGQFKGTIDDEEPYQTSLEKLQMLASAPIPPHPCQNHQSQNKGN